MNQKQAYLGYCLGYLVPVLLFEFAYRIGNARTRLSLWLLLIGPALSITAISFGKFSGRRKILFIALAVPCSIVAFVAWMLFDSLMFPTATYFLD